MFSVTQFSCATGYFTFGHEIGHNLGMFHDSGTEKSCTETAAFNYGYRNPNAEFRTILAYDCKMGECDLMTKNGCPRVQRFSNSDSKYTYNGKPIGDSRRDNAKQLNNVRARVAAYFPAMNCQTDAECNDSNSNTTDNCNSASKVCVFTPLGATTNAPTTAPSTRSPTKPVSRLPTKVPSRAPIQAVATSQKPILGTPNTFPIRTPTREPTFATAQPLQPVRAPVSTDSPNLSPSIPAGLPPIPTQNVPNRAPIVVVDIPINGQEQTGFFSMIFNFFSGFWTRLVDGR